MDGDAGVVRAGTDPDARPPTPAARRGVVPEEAILSAASRNVTDVGFARTTSSRGASRRRLEGLGLPRWPTKVELAVAARAP